MVGRQFLRVCAVLSILAVADIAVAQTTDRYDGRLTYNVTQHVNSGDCAGALKLLQGGLSANSPAAALLAGTMYERGICLKRNWDSAVGNYVIAYNGGEHAAAYRLAAGYAAPAGGPDAAAALWWLTQLDTMGGGENCSVEKSERSDPDRFVAVLQTWTPARLAACNYMAGVMATIAGEMRYPYENHYFEPSGTVMVRLKPALAQVDLWTKGEAGLFGTALPAGQEYELRATRKSRFEKGVRTIADNALARYPQPAGIDPAWTYELAVIFESH